MAEDSTEALARSQLEILYRLGILERSPEDGELESEDSRLNQSHEAFLAALPPPTQIHSMHTRPLPLFANDSSSASLVASDNRSGDYYSESSGEKLPRVSRHHLHNHMPRRGRCLRSSGSLMSSFDSVAPQTIKRDNRMLQMWFRQWRVFVQGRREKARLRSAVGVFLKQSVITKWTCFLRQRRYEHDKKRLLDSWKLSRAILHWAQWKQRCRAVRRLLNGGRSSFMGRLMQQRIWRQWIHFSKRSMYVSNVLSERTRYIHCRLIRAVWTELRIHAFRARKTREALGRYFQSMRKLQSIQERQRLMCSQYQVKVNLERKRVLLRRWRAFAQRSGRNKRLALRVQFDVCRRRYFSLWCQAACTSDRIANLRKKISSRTLCQHFFAWEKLAKAINLGDQVRSLREKNTREVYFRAFKDQAKFSAHCKHVQIAMTHLRLSKIVAYLHAWTVERKNRNEGIRQIRHMWQARLLRCAWFEGWYRLHHKRRAINHACRTLEVRHFNAWKRFHRAHQEFYLHEARAGELHNKFCCQRTLMRWKVYLGLRLEHRRKLAKAQEYYQKRLLQRGVVILWSAVYRNAQNSLRSHHLRQKLRHSTKKRHFHVWQILVQTKRRNAERVYSLQQCSAYQRSICNPSRRSWDRWTTFVSLRKQRHRCDQHFRLHVKRRVLFDWHRQAKLEARCRAIALRKSMKAVKNILACWKSRVEKWRKVCAIHELAERVYERRLCTRVMRDWRCWSSHYHRVRLCGHSIQRRLESKLQSNAFIAWHEKFQVKKCFAKLRRGRLQRQIRACFHCWHAYFSKQKAFTRKLIHFKQVYGVYPVSSIVARVWDRWKHATTQSRHTKLLHRKYLLRQARRCWFHWKIFRAAYRALGVWRHVAATMSSSNNRLGMRIRRLRESRHCALQRRMLDEWKGMIQQRRNLQDRQSLCKHKLNRELEGAHWNLQKAIQFHLSSLFRRWCAAVNKDTNLAMGHYRTRLLRVVVRLWWKTTIHSKQERVLLEAQQTIGKLSYYHPQQQAYLAQVCRTDNQAQLRKPPKRTSKVTAPKNTWNEKAESMRNMRRMLDPTESQSYTKLHQESGREISPTEPSNRDIDIPQHAPTGSFASARHMPASNLCHSKYTAQEGALLKSDLRRLNHGTPKIIFTDRNFCTIPLPPPTSHESETMWSNQKQLEHTQLNCLCQGIHDKSQQNRVTACGLENNSLQSQTKTAETELPLFDDEEQELAIADPKTRVDQADLGAVPEESLDLTLDVRHEQPVNLKNDVQHREWVNRIANTLDPPQLTMLHELRQSECDAIERVPTVFEPCQSLAPSMASSHRGRQHKFGVVRNRSAPHKPRIKAVHSTKTEVRPLADILALPGSNGTKPIAEKGSADADMCVESEAEWDSSVIQEIVGFYVDSVMEDADTGTSNDGRVKHIQTRPRVCFRMVRDLALFQNDFYLDEMQKVYDANFNWGFTDLTRYAFVDKREEQSRLELFLEQVVENHPAYRQYVNLTLRRKLRSTYPLGALNWLAQCHLRPHFLLQKKAKIRLRKSKDYWIWEQMPDDMDMALDKLLPAIAKYIRVLGQFFLRQAVQSTSTTDKPQDYRMSSMSFINLMKQVRVFPQLFHRRELENAVRLSSCSSPESEELNFPEFIEALVRCSCSLRWGELDRGKHAAHVEGTVVVIKFVMLIFAMEGQGTVLKKRNEDVNSILGFLGEQQKKKQAEKMFRFRKMLLDNKRRVRASRKHQIPSVWNQVRLQFSPRTSPTRSPTRSHDTFDELTESWDGGSPGRTSTEPFVFDAQTNQPFELDASPAPSLKSKSSKYYDEQDHFGATGCVQDARSLNSDSVASGVSSLSEQTGVSPLPYAGKATSTQHESTSTTLAESDVSCALHRDQNEGLSFTDHASNVNSVGRVGGTTDDDHEYHSITSVHPPGLVEPMEKDDFLREILNSIGDVEVVLNQPRFVGSNYSKLGKRFQQGTTANEPMISTFSRKQAGSEDGIPSLNDLAVESLLYRCGGRGDVDSEVSVRDSMLNYLTDVERFTESSDKTSQVAIADLSGLPFEQKQPSQV